MAHEFTTELLDITRNSIGTSINENGVLVEYPANEKRFDYDPVTGEVLGLLIEEERTNLMLYSEDFDNAVWTQVGDGITDTTTTTIGPDSSSVKVYTFSTSSAIYQDNGTIADGVVYGGSIWIKGNKTGSLGIRVSSNAFSDTVGVNITEEWTRFEVTQSRDGVTDPIRLLVDNRSEEGYGIEGLEVSFYGAQVEVGSNITSYIPTSGSVGTRSADVMSINNMSWYNDEQGTFYVEWLLPKRLGKTGISSQPLFSLNDGSTDNTIRVFADDGTRFLYQVRSSGDQVVDIAHTSPITENQIHKASISYAENSFKFSLDGNTIQSDSSGSLPVGISIFELGEVDFGGRLQGYIRSLKYFPTELSDDEHIKLTS